MTYVDQVMMRDLNDPPARKLPTPDGATGWCPCCGDWVTKGHHEDDEVPVKQKAGAR